MKGQLPLEISEKFFGEITFLEYVGPNRSDFIDCPPDGMPEGSRIFIKGKDYAVSAAAQGVTTSLFAVGLSAR
jgi:hypothetical protein